MLNRLKKYFCDESASESTEKIIIIGGAIILAVSCVSFYTYQVNKGASDGAGAAEKAMIEAMNS